MGSNPPPKLFGRDLTLDWAVHFGIFFLQGSRLHQCDFSTLCCLLADTGLWNSNPGAAKHEEVEGQPSVSQLPPEDAENDSFSLLKDDCTTTSQHDVCIGPWHSI